MFDQKNSLALLQKAFPKMNFNTECMLSDYTYMKVGGKAAIMTFPESLSDMTELLQFCTEQNIFYIVLGKGSNLIVNDDGVDALFINTNNLVAISLLNNTMITVQTGTTLSAVSDFALVHELSGFEFACGIPGSVGGAIYMNAGAYDGEMKNVVFETKAFVPHKGIVTFSNQEQQFAYRKSVFSSTNMVVLETTIHLIKDNPQKIADKINDLTKKREEKQPLDLPSSGSTFKRPDGYFAGKLITDAGLKGFSVGGASVSEKHAGFIVNTNNATADDILRLINHIQTTVQDKFGVILEPEVKFLQKDGTFKKFHLCFARKDK
ncbi:MAG: UDP-N-acetylmuramate dehydrogenase [Brevinema sp.]